MISHQTINWAKCAGHFEGIDEIRFTGHGDLYHLFLHNFRSHANCKTHGAMTYEIKKAARLKSAEKNQFGRFNHW